MKGDNLVFYTDRKHKTSDHRVMCHRLFGGDVYDGFSGAFSTSEAKHTPDSD